MGTQYIKAFIISNILTKHLTRDEIVLENKSLKLWKGPRIFSQIDVVYKYVLKILTLF